MLSLFKVLPLLLLAEFAVSFSVGPRANPLRYGTYTGTKVTSKVTQLSASLKPAAIPLMDSGKAFARSGEFIIDLTTAEDLYGGALSAAGANIRNAGDCIAQAAASCRFKTGTELVIDELREAATCLDEASTKLKQAVEEALVDERPEFGETIGKTERYVKGCSLALEEAGAKIMRRDSIPSIGENLVEAGKQLDTLAPLFAELAPERREAKDAYNRMSIASSKMIEAGNGLQGILPKASGKSWLKGGTP